ncbi:MAG: glycoside hydrolase family 16 protein [Armatimonadota bacterium]|nr:glycoside hydrolase family 16 protein [Armatimonadota bacterium]
MSFQIRRLISVGCLFAILALAMLGTTGAGAVLVLRITQTPGFGSCGLVQGTTSGVAPADYYVAMLIYVPGSGFWSKPYCEPRYILINPDGSWSASMCSGGIDNMATMVEAYLFPKTSYPAGYPQCVLGAGCVPESLVSASVASDRVLRSGQRKFRWSGYDWLVKTSGVGLVGPGSNYFSDSTDNAWVDANGRLHLKIANRSGVWYCAEVSTDARIGYGTYRFYCDSRVDNMDPNVVLGLFTWSDFSCSYAHREIDIEFSKWSDPANSNNAQFLIQPYDVSGNMHRFVMTSAATSTHSFTWRPNDCAFVSVEGHCAVPNQCTAVDSWTFPRPQDVPPSSDERLHLNLWLNNGLAPANGQEAEVVLSGFEFEPWRDPARPIYGINNRTADYGLIAGISSTATFRLWGRVLLKDCGGISINDGSTDNTGSVKLIRVIEPGNTFGLSDFVQAEGLLTPGSPTLLDAVTGRVTGIR